MDEVGSHSRAEPVSSTSATMPPRRFQFSVWHLLAAMAWLATLLALLLHVRGLVAFWCLAVLWLAGLCTQRTRRMTAWWVTPLVLFAWLVPSVHEARDAARRSNCASHLFGIKTALHNYHDVYGCFPPAYVADADGRPLHSWRVLLLPFIDEVALYRQYRFDEPWDGPNNRQLLSQCPDYYRCPVERDGAETQYLAVVGDDTAWPGARGLRLDEVTDDPDRTILVVEVTSSGIPWTAPFDLDMRTMTHAINARGGNCPCSRHFDGANVVWVGRSVRFLPDDLPTDQLRAMLTIAGGGVVDD